MHIATRSFAAAVLAAALGSPSFTTVVAQGAAQQPPRSMNPVRTFDATGAPDTSLFAPLNLPPGNIYRSGSGAPGPRYWQQRADYDLHGTLDTAAKTLHGEMTLRYTNNSPDTLRFVWFQVEQNAFKNGSLNSFVFPPDSRFGARNFEGGDVFDRFNQVSAGKKTPLKSRVEGTVMKVDLVSPLPPGQATTFDVAWHFMIPGITFSPTLARTAGAPTARYTSSPSGTRASVSTTTYVVGTPNRISARVSSISSTATTTSRSPSPRDTSLPRRGRCRTPPKC
jgi:hypothetical protein